MSELVPLPLPVLLRRAFREYEREGKIFDLPQNKFFRGFEDLDLSVNFHGHRAATPLGPAAGPHGQLAQNIALSWLGGSRIIELKTVQILDELKIPRPCIDIANIGYNVEWSQELKLEQSLREYVKAAMLVEILKSQFPLPADTVFDMSVGYNLEGIRSPRVRSWIETMMNASPVIEELRTELSGEWQRYRDLPFPPRVSNTISLSTFHGCPAREIEGIVTFLLAEMGCHVCVKLNPTLLGQKEVEHLLHDVLDYREIRLHPPAFDNDLQFDEALDLVPRLQAVARQHNRSLGLKFTNTLVVKNHKAFFSDEQMYMSAAPLHVLALNLIQKFRAKMPQPIPISFSAGLDPYNVAAAVAMNFVPVTTCSDLLRPGGYSRLIKYLENLAVAMRETGATRISDFILNFRGQAEAAHGDVHTAGLLNTPILVAEATANPRYAWERNKGVPRKIGSKLWLYDCINCDKCVPVCPNDANFVYASQPAAIEYENFELTADGVRPIPGGILRVMKGHQLANYADFCNDCGNCDVFCPEDGGPYVEKPRFFGSLETYEKYAGRNGFYINRQTIYGTIAGESYVLALDPHRDCARFERSDAEIEIRISDARPLSWTARPGTGDGARSLDMLPYFKLKLLLEAVTDPRRVNFVNAANPLPGGRGSDAPLQSRDRERALHPNP